MRVLTFSAAVAALALAGCVDTGSIGSAGSLGMSGQAARPKTIVVGDFTIASDLVVIDHGFSVRLERKGGDYPILERRQRTAARVNDEIVATIIATLREAGLDAHPGSEEGMSSRDNMLFVSGRLRAADESADKNKQKYAGFGPGRSGVVANMNLSRFAWGARKTVLTFMAGGKGKERAPRNAKLAKARDTDIAAALVAEDAVPEKLSPDVEAQARGLGGAIAAHIVDYAKTQGWVNEAPAVADAVPEKKPAKKKPAA